jgi:hypothetical protein
MDRGLLAVSAIAGLLTAGVASAEDHLTPEDKFDQVYQATVKSVFGAAYGPDIRARAVIEPSFQREFAGGVKETGGHYSVFMLTPSKQIWAGNLLEEQQTAPKTVKVTACEIPIKQGDGARMVAVWKTVLSRVTPGQRELGTDGETGHYSMTVDGHELAGQAWEPEENSEAGMMRSIAYAIHDACEANDKRELTKIEPLLDRLEKLPAQHQP